MGVSSYLRTALLLAVVCLSNVLGQQGILFPRDSESRQTKSLDGIWNFRSEAKGDRDLGLSQQWYSKPLSEVMTRAIPAERT